jgi:hypothetical protein
VQSVESLVDLYESWDKAEPGKGFAAKAEPWKRKLKVMKAASPAGR